MLRAPLLPLCSCSAPTCLAHCGCPFAATKDGGLSFGCSPSYASMLRTKGEHLLCLPRSKARRWDRSMSCFSMHCSSATLGWKASSSRSTAPAACAKGAIIFYRLIGHPYVQPQRGCEAWGPGCV
jgi:hypothetical protein